MKIIGTNSEKFRPKDAGPPARSTGTPVFVSSSARAVELSEPFSAAGTFHIAEGIRDCAWTVSDAAEMALWLHIGGSRMHDRGAGLVVPSSPEVVLLILPMNKSVSRAVCLSLAVGSWLNVLRAQNGSPVTTTGAPATLMAVTVAPTVGAVVVEASTNLVDWTDVTTLLPNDGTGISIDTQSTNYPYRFYRVRSVVTAANNLVLVNSMSDLRALTAVTSNADVTLRGYYTAGDGGGGRFYWDPNSTESDDGGITIVPTSNPPTGRWKRTDQSEINVKWFGAVGDGVTPDSMSIQAALDYVNRKHGGKVFLPKGTYLLDGASDWLAVGSDTLLEGAGTATVILSKTYLAVCNMNWDVGNCNITIQNLAINCSNQGVDGIGFFGVTDSTIHNVRILDPQGYGIWLFRWGDTAQGEGKPPRRVTVSDCHLSGIVDTGIECSGAVGCTIVGNTVTGTKGIAGYYVWNGATDCTFTGNVAEGEGTNNVFKGYEVQPADLLTSPAPNKTQTQRINFVGNVARNVWIGARVSGSPPNKPSDILIQGNSFFGLAQGGCGVQVWNALRVSVTANRISGFGYALGLNEVAVGSDYNGAAYVTIDNNVISGGGGSILYGNLGGSLSGNKFYGQQVHSVWIYAWKNCTVNNNVFINPGANQDAVGISVFDYNGVGATGNSFGGNMCIDDRETKYANGTIVFGAGNHDHNFITKNSARGAKAGALAFTNFGSGTNNIVADNIDAEPTAQ
jgi:hypothetical protein